MASRPMTVADFSPGTGHLRDCEADTASWRPCNKDCHNHLFAVAQDLERVVNRLRNEQDEVDRNARAYGWEIGNQFPVSGPKEKVTFGALNPFIYPDWRRRAGLA